MAAVVGLALTDSGSLIAGVTWLLLVLGVVGSLVPNLPGHWLLAAAVLWERGMLREESTLSSTCMWGVLILFIVAQVLEAFTGVAGARWFGGSKWGGWGALVGGVVGMLFFPLGLFVGPLLGAMLAEMLFAKKTFQPAVKSGFGSLVGTVAGLVIKIILGVVMATWIVIDLLR